MKRVYNSVEEFKQHTAESFTDNAPIYMTSGGFDPMHVGHLRCILSTVEMAEKNEGLVVVVVNGDNFLIRKKGKPFMNQDERAEIIAGIRGVDAAVIWDDNTQNVIGAIKALEPSFFTKGGDRAAPKDIPEWDICQSINCEVIFNVGGGKVQSSSWLIEQSEKGKDNGSN
jgi:cytidyltransferase-like protein